MERDSISQVQKLEGELRGRQEYVKQVEKDLTHIRSFANSRCLLRYMDVTEKAAGLAKDNNILRYKTEHLERTLTEMQGKVEIYEDQIQVMSKELRMKRSKGYTQDIQEIEKGLKKVRDRS